MVAAFDLDGTLVDTREAVIAAYEQVGIPKHWTVHGWGKPWQAWLPQACANLHISTDPLAVHQAKNDAYPGQLHLARGLPTLRSLRLHIARGDHAYVLTGASPTAAMAVLRQFAGTTLDAIQCVIPGLTVEDKIKVLKELQQKSHTQCVYYDDDDHACFQIREALDENRWAVFRVVNKER